MDKPFPWSRRHESCRNCGTQELNHKARGYCRRCYPLVLRREKVEAWDLDDPDTLVHYPSEREFRSRQWFNRIKTGYLRQLDDRLRRIQVREARRSESVEGLDLEFLLTDIAALCGIRGKSLYHGVSGSFDTFTPDQRQLLYQLLIRIEESLPWRGIDWRKIFDQD
jgi:hypothetical protein